MVSVTMDEYSNHEVFTNMTATMADTCIYLNYFFDEEGKLIDVGEEARVFFNKVKDGEFELVVSDHLEWQLKDKLGDRYCEYEELKAEIKKNNNLIEVVTEDKDKRIARTLPTEFEDALHFQLACKGGAEILVTRNIQDYAELDGMNGMKIRFPEHAGLF